MKKILFICLTILSIVSLIGINAKADDFETDKIVLKDLAESFLLVDDGEIPADVIPPSDTFPNIPVDASDIEPSTIFGRDDRVNVYDTNRDPYRKVVFIISYFKNGTPNGGTGVLVAPNKVLTAAHIIRKTDTNEWAEYVAVFPGRNRDYYPYGGLTGTNFHVFSSYKNNTASSYTNEKMNDDLAVVSLPYSFPSSVGFLPIVNNVQAQQRVATIGYPGSDRIEDVGKIGGMYVVSGPIMNIEDKIIRYQMDTTPGHSGGPVLNNSNQIVAINVAENQSRNIARRLNNEGISLVNAGLQNATSGNGISNLIATHRLYNIGEKYHFYTSGSNEKDALVRMGWKYEGIAWRTDTGGASVYRLYNSGTRRHLYTTSLNEKDTLVIRGWNYEGIVWNSMGNKNVYRLYNSVLKVHLYTMDENEKNVLSTRGWNYEGIAWKVE
ncbi:choline binding protein G [Streptococcus varani]|uniref:Serine protease n=1 Tax=Streptococcus varani TaxID=1608583 RepID=A0A0E4CTP6_9STRE|nr:trypsin-like peptidase domain-containing protein [Streptococcus varani]CQR25938.1 choline binding protein G [Streptococcus varani]